MAKKKNPNKPAEPIEKPAEVPQVSLGQVVGDTSQSVTDLSKSVGTQNLRGFQLGASTLADFYASDGRTLTIDPAEKKRLDHLIKSNGKKIPGAKKTVDTLQLRFDTAQEELRTAEAEGNTKQANRLRKIIRDLTPKLEAAKTNLNTFETTVADSKTALRTTGPSVSQIMRDANPETYAAVDRAQGFASKIGQTTAEGQRYLDTAAQGYRANEIGPNAISASQVGNVDNIAAQQIQAARIGDFGRANAVNAANVADIRAGQVGMGQLGGNLMQQALQKSLSDGSLNAQGTRDAIQSARQGFAARGLATGNASLAAELLNRDRYARSRQFEDLQFAGGVQAQDLDRQFQNVGNQLAADRSNQETAARISLANQQAAMQAEMANLEARKQAAITQGQMDQAAALANQQANLAAATQNQNTQFALGQANANLSQQANLANQANAFNSQVANENARLAGSQQNLNFLGNAANYVDAQNRAGFAANVDAAALGQAYNPLNQFLGTSSQNIFGTNNLGSLTLAPAAQIGLGVASQNADIARFNNQTGLQVDSFNANMLDSRYNSWANNNAALQGAQMQAGAASQAGTMGMIGSIGGAAIGAVGLAVF